MTRNIQQIIEDHMARWQLERLERKDNQLQTAGERRWPNIVTISQAFKSNGSAIAQRVGELLKIPVYNREIVEHIASQAEISLETVLTLDEHIQSRMEEYLTSLIHERNFERSDELSLLNRTVLALWQHGPCVLVGHGCVHLVSRVHSLAIRLTAPEGLRIRRAAETEQLNLHAAQQLVHRKDAEREAFHRRFFGAHIDDFQYYDLILNTSELRPDNLARIIAEAYYQKFPQ